MEYIAQFFTFLAAVVAVFGKASANIVAWPPQINRTGLIALVVAAGGLGTSLVITSRDNAHKDLLVAELRTANEALTEAREKSRVLDEKTENLIATAEELKVQNSGLAGELKAYRAFLADIRTQSERQVQQTMSQYVPLSARGKWDAPNMLSAGSRLVFHLFSCRLQVEWDFGRRAVEASAGRRRELPIIGNSGAQSKWRVRNLSNRECAGKIYKYDTPRSRSVDWSWIEEKIRKSGLASRAAD